MAEQVELPFNSGPEASCHALGRDIFAVDTVNDLLDLEIRESPIDRRPRGFGGIALAAKIAGDAPAYFKTRPARRTPRSHPPGEFAAALFLNYKHADAVQQPMPGHDRRVPPSDERVGD